jgi:hypothetical protein
MPASNKPITEEDVRDIVQEYLKSGGFTIRKLTDMPTDALQVTSRRYVNLNGPSTQRPVSSVVGQFYLDMTLAAGNGKPTWWNGSGFIDSSGTYV